MGQAGAEAGLINTVLRNIYFSGAQEPARSGLKWFPLREGKFLQKAPISTSVPTHPHSASGMTLWAALAPLNPLFWGLQKGSLPPPRPQHHATPATLLPQRILWTSPLSVLGNPLPKIKLGAAAFSAFKHSTAVPQSGPRDRSGRWPGQQTELPGQGRRGPFKA